MYAVLEPSIQVFFDVHVFVVVEDPVCAVREDLDQLVSDILTLLSVDGLALPSVLCLNPIAGHVKTTLLVASNRSLAVATPTHLLGPYQFYRLDTQGLPPTDVRLEPCFFYTGDSLM